MSDRQFTEIDSTDLTERAIARRASRILNDRTLKRAERERLVLKAEGELRDHRAQKEQQRRLAALVAGMKARRCRSLQRASTRRARARGRDGPRPQLHPDRR